MILLRHAEPRILHGSPAEQWPLTERGRSAARALGGSITRKSTASIVWTSPERRAFETAQLTGNWLELRVRTQLSEVKKPWYAASSDHAEAAAGYLRGEPMEGWESSDMVVARIAQLETAFSSGEEDVIVVSHGLLITTWLDRVIGLDDPFEFWANLRTPDAWMADFEGKSLKRIAAT
jgi:broad specificity phosphatase PhoE